MDNACAMILVLYFTRREPLFPTRPASWHPLPLPLNRLQSPWLHLKHGSEKCSPVVETGILLKMLLRFNEYCKKSPILVVPAFIIYIALIEFIMNYGLEQYFASIKNLRWYIKKPECKQGSGQFLAKIAENIGLYRIHLCSIYKS